MVRVDRFWVDWYGNNTDPGPVIRRWHEGYRTDPMSFEGARAALIDHYESRIAAATEALTAVRALTPTDVPPEPRSPGITDAS